MAFRDDTFDDLKRFLEKRLDADLESALYGGIFTNAKPEDSVFTVEKLKTSMRELQATIDRCNDDVRTICGISNEELRDDLNGGRQTAAQVRAQQQIEEHRLQANPLFGGTLAVGGSIVIFSEACFDFVEDWSLVRSPARARRRQSHHRQNIIMRMVPWKYAVTLDNGRTIMIHPAMKDDLDRLIDEANGANDVGHLSGIQGPV